MGTKDKRYTIEIFIRFQDKNISGSNYVWHNSNGGLSKVVSNLNKLHKDKWDYFIARRKSNKEIVGIFYNQFSIEIPAVRLYLKFRPNSKKNGVIANFPFKRNGFNINRGINMANSIILELNEDYFSIPENIYQKAINRAKKDLFDYYTLQRYQVMENEIELGDFVVEKFIFRKDRPGSYPTNDYP